MKFLIRATRPLLLVCIFSAAGFSLDREAFSFVNYDLRIQIDPEQHRLGARGKITLRNDTEMPQKIAVLQVSSSLDWRSVTVGGRNVQFVSQPYTSDIDHTGALSEAIVTLPQSVPPKGAVELEVAYDGLVLRDSTRLTRIGTPEPQANSSDWDRIAANFTGVRGIGYVAWYPIASEAANLSEGNSVFEAVGRWKTREADSTMRLKFSVVNVASERAAELLMEASACHSMAAVGSGPEIITVQCNYDLLGFSTPTFVIGGYRIEKRNGVQIHYWPEHEASAAAFADESEKVLARLRDWFGELRQPAMTVDLPDQDAAPFESGSMRLVPLPAMDRRVAGMVAAHQLAHAAFFSPRPWIGEGLAHFAQALYLEHEGGRNAALDYMALHRSAFIEAEVHSPEATPKGGDDRSLVNTSRDEFYRSKAMYVWWMLRDIIGDAALKKVLASYHAEQDRDPSYMPRLIQAQTSRDLSWFFDDWVYHDRGLPDFTVETAFSRKTPGEAYVVTITVDNRGRAGAEVPVTVTFARGETAKRVEVPAKSKGVIRVEVPASPQEVTVNDGSVPESDMSNNLYKIEGASGTADTH